MTDSKEIQDAEAAARTTDRRSAEAIRADAELDASALNNNSDTPEDPAPIARAPRDPDTRQDPRRPSVGLTPGDDKRSRMISEFRATRETEREQAEQDNEDLLAFTHGGMPPELVHTELTAEDVGEEPADEPEEPASTEAIEDVTKQKRKLKIRGKEVELTQEEIEAAAMRALAADGGPDSYLSEARRTLDEAKALRADLEASRVASPGKRPAQGEDTETADTAGDQPDSGEQPDDYEALVQEIQYGDPQQAASKLRTLVQKEGAKQSQETFLTTRLNDEGNRSLRQFREFQDQNPALTNDPLASAAIERKVLELQYRDIVDLGIVEEARIPKDPGTISNWHRQCRAEGRPVRDVSRLLADAKGAYEAWKGITEPNPTTAVTPTSEPAETGSGKQKVTVTVDRSDRKTALQQQPSRTGVPRQTAQQAAPQRRDPSDVVQDMIKRRNGPRGRFVA